MHYSKEKGQGILEYALLLIFVAFVIIVVLVLLGPAIGNIYSNINSTWPIKDSSYYLSLAFV
jgi:pilus assembly protein Flp/PilA